MQGIHYFDGVAKTWNFKIYRRVRSTLKTLHAIYLGLSKQFTEYFLLELES